jgi:hypothetical protein
MTGFRMSNNSYQNERLVIRVAYAYVSFLFALEVLLFTLSALLHVTVLMGARQPFQEFNAMLFDGSVVVGVLIIAYIKNGLMWRNQIKSCPAWMWKAALILGGYALVTIFLEPIFPEGDSYCQRPLVMSSFPVGFDAISFCVIYSVLWSGYLSKSEVSKRTGHSLLMLAYGVIVFLAYRAGYLHHPSG